MIDTIKHPLIEILKNINHKNHEYFILDDENHIEWLMASNNPQYDIQWLMTWDKENIKKYQIKTHWVKSTIFYHLFKNDRIKWIAYVKFNNHTSWISPCIVTLDNVMDYGNIGSVIRNSYLLGVKEMALINPFNCFYSKIIQASRGLIFNMKIGLFNNFDDYKNFGPINYLHYLTDCDQQKFNGDHNESVENSIEKVKVFGDEPESPLAKTMDKVIVFGDEPESPLAKTMDKVIVFGNESTGITHHWNAINNKYYIHIPMIANKLCDSMNVASVAAILVYKYIH